MLRDLFSPQEDPYLRAADHRSGAASILCGIAANRSIAEGGWVKIDDLIHGLDRPDYRLVLGMGCLFVGAVFGAVALTTLLLKALT